VWAAVASEELCHALNMTIPDILFTAGLLHDMGKIILDPHLVQHRDAICRLAAEQDLSFQVAEEQVLGINHSEAGAILLDHWHFPGELIAAARWHHEPQQATEHETTVRIVHIADALAYSEGLGCGIDGMMYKLSPDTISLLGLTKKALEYAASQTLDKMQQIEKLLAE
jgi:HD-like signal output (HDOD) protein